MIKQKRVGSLCGDELGSVCRGEVGSIWGGEVGSHSKLFPYGVERIDQNQPWPDTNGVYFMPRINDRDPSDYSFGQSDYPTHP